METRIQETVTASHHTITRSPLKFNKSIAIYNFENDDSLLAGQIWYLDDSIVKKEGKTNFQIPMQFEIWDGLIERADRKKELETFTENICEVGGSSAWNKYCFTYDSLQRPILIEHYKAWWYEGLSDIEEPKERPDKPEYFHANTITRIYESNSTKETVKSLEYNSFSSTEKIFDNQNRLLIEVYLYGEKGRKYFYNYIN